MKKYMVVYVIDGEENAWFSDDSTAAENFKMDVECGASGYAEVYKYEDESEDECGGYEFLYC